ncbi:MAG: alpha/beta hydrolase [Gemmatimonadales bacterium]
MAAECRVRYRRTPPLQRVTDVCLLGVRLGATIAALAAAGRGDVAGFACIAPVVNGRAWLREVRALQAAMGRAEPPPEFALPEGVSESVGLLLAAETRESITRVDLAAMPTPPAPVCLILDRDDRPPNAAWCARLEELSAAVDQHVLPGFVEMVLDPHEAEVPEQMLGTFTKWLTAQFPAEATQHTAKQALTGPVSVSPGVEESAHFLDDAHRLFGVVTTPVGPPPTRALLLLNSGSNHHIGNGRMYVKFARRLARQGWLVLRYDVGGIGDSAPHPGAPDNDVYTANAIGDLATAIAFVRGRPGIARVEVSGLCSGAYHGFKGAVAGLAMDGITVVNPLVFFWKDGMTLAYPPFQMVQAAAQYQQSAMRLDKWLKLLRGQVKLRPILEVLAHRAADRATGLVRNLRRAIGLPPAEDLGRELEEVVARGTALRFVFSVGDPGEALLRVGAGWVLPRLERSGQVPIAYLPDCDHSLSASWMHELLWQELTGGLGSQ